MATELDEQVASQFEGNFLDASDIPKSGTTVTISEVVGPKKEKDARGKLIDKTIISFKGCKKRLIAGKIHLRIIKLHHGKLASQWIDKPIPLTVCWLEESFGERNVPCVRVKPPEGVPIPSGWRKWYGRETPFTTVKNRNPGDE